MIDRCTFLAGTGVVLLTAPLAAEGQQAGCSGSLSYCYHRSSQSDLATGRTENG